MRRKNSFGVTFEEEVAGFRYKEELCIMYTSSLTNQLRRKCSVGSVAISPPEDDVDMSYMMELEDLQHSISTGRVAQQARRDSLTSLNSQMLSRKNSFNNLMINRRNSLTVPAFNQFSRW